MFFRHSARLVIAIFLTSSACSQEWNAYPPNFGGEDVITVEMPFSAGYRSQCVQGPMGTYSHDMTSTLYDVDLDTPNDRDDIVYAPATSRLYVNDDGADGFGLHVNLDLGDGTYIVLGHMKEVWAEHDRMVRVGDPIGLEGATGAASGDHVHMGRHKGNPKRSAVAGKSVEGLRLHILGVDGNKTSVAVMGMMCDMEHGGFYESVNSTVPTGYMGESASEVDLPDTGEMQVCVPVASLESDVSALRLYALTEEDAMDHKAFYVDGDEVVEALLIDDRDAVFCGTVQAGHSEWVAVNGFAYVGPDPSAYNTETSWWRHFATSEMDRLGGVFMDVAPSVDSDGDGDPSTDRDRDCVLESFPYSDQNMNGPTDFNSVQMAFVCR